MNLVHAAVAGFGFFAIVACSSSDSGGAAGGGTGGTAQGGSGGTAQGGTGGTAQGGSAGTAQGGSSGDGGTASSLDGTWTWVSATCNGTAMDFGSVLVTLTITGGTGTIASKIDANCTMTSNLTITYPATDSFVWTIASAPTCTPPNCLASAGACDGTVVNQVFTGTYTIAGNTAVATIPKTPADNSGCASGLEVITLQK